MKRENMGGLAAEDQLALESAVLLLENPSFIARVGDVIGTPIEKAVALLPVKASEAVSTAAEKAIGASLKLAIKTMDYHDPQTGKPPQSSDWWHKGASIVTGGVGGAFGLPALLIELPISTTIIMRSIADIARSEGADLSVVQMQIECIQVLAFGGRTRSDDGAEIGYFVAREAMAKAAAEAAAYVAKHGIKKEGAPALLRLVLMIAERYSIPVSAKAAAQLLPAVGAVGGALVNTLFMDHFQNMARGHFAVRRLENKYGLEVVREEYAAIRDTIAAKRAKA